MAISAATSVWLGRIRRGLRKPPGIIASRMKAEVVAELERFNGPRRDRRLDEARLLSVLQAGCVNEVWERLAARPPLGVTGPVRVGDYERLCPGDADRILKAAEKALAHEVDLLGSGRVDLGERIDWHRDYKTGLSWPTDFFRQIDYNNRDRPSDVKFPWELSRLQWLIPAGQAYLLTGDERYAQGVRAVLESWIADNKYVYGVNWACTMEVALRIVSWIWFFQVFASSRAWEERTFRKAFVRTLYLHADFTARHLERSDVNGNHYTANAAGLALAGLFFGSEGAPRLWTRLGWEILCTEMPRQVYADGVDFELSVAYHRLVLELFLLPALYRGRCGRSIPNSYRERLIAMTHFSADYSRADGTVPLWGDADDGRVLPLGGQDTNDHRYIAGLIGAAWGVADLRQGFAGSRAEIFWLLGKRAAASLSPSQKPEGGRASRAYEYGGVYIMRSERDHVFIDCGPVGLAGRGGHGHNDCLSFEAALDDVHLVTDCGSYVYTASYDERNRFRSTSYHNTPIVDGQEINRFLGPGYLWNLHYDAKPQARLWRSDVERDVFQGSHSGYERLRAPVRPVRTLILDKGTHVLVGVDRFEGDGEHDIEIPFHLASGVQVQAGNPGSCILRAGGRRFMFYYSDTREWDLAVDEGFVSPRYGVKRSTARLSLIRRGPPVTLGWGLAPEPAGERGRRILDEAIASYGC